jgi:hypothetical protein
MVEKLLCQVINAFHNNNVSAFITMPSVKQEYQSTLLITNWKRCWKTLFHVPFRDLTVNTEEDKESPSQGNRNAGRDSNLGRPG